MEIDIEVLKAVPINNLWLNWQFELRIGRHFKMAAAAEKNQSCPILVKMDIYVFKPSRLLRLIWNMWFKNRSGYGRRLFTFCGNVNFNYYYYSNSPVTKNHWSVRKFSRKWLICLRWNFTTLQRMQNSKRNFPVAGDFFNGSRSEAAYFYTVSLKLIYLENYWLELTILGYLLNLVVIRKFLKKKSSASRWLF